MAQAVLREPHTGLNTGNRDQISKIKWANLGVGAVLQVFQVTSLGQPLENIKTYVAANRQASLVEAVKNIRSRGLFQGFYQGLVPWVGTVSGGQLMIQLTLHRHGGKQRQKGQSSSWHLQKLKDRVGISLTCRQLYQLPLEVLLAVLLKPIL